MGCWGMGMTQSDQFMETYEAFMDEYNEGAAVPNITKKILEQYLKEFSADDPILHDVWFGLYDAPEFLPPSSLKPIGHIEVPAKVYVSLFDKWHGWNGLALISGRRKDFTADYSETTSYNLNNLMHDKICPDSPLLCVNGICGCGSREELQHFVKYVEDTVRAKEQAP